ncbi:ferrous iron transport protein A [Ruminococcus sp. YRD2003]|uniref:FeoA family protein n=1 Tax=Ruminococcus sp. YRD2003 TaxID=1452313 RepID=UPI0008D4CE68|nr:ferrous iron transport protein A [Ruminococcus flavefaciens]
MLFAAPLLFIISEVVDTIAQTVLSSLREGDTCTVSGLENHGAMRQRLGELGFVSGVQVTCLQRSFLGDPAAYSVKGAVIALRDSDARCVAVDIKQGRA